MTGTCQHCSAWSVPMCQVCFWNLHKECNGERGTDQMCKNWRLSLLKPAAKLNERTTFPVRDQAFGQYFWEKYRVELSVPAFQRQTCQPWWGGHQHCSFFGPSLLTVSSWELKCVWLSPCKEARTVQYPCCFRKEPQRCLLIYQFF